MKYTPEDLYRPNAIEYVRNHRAMFLEQEPVSGTEIAKRLSQSLSASGDHTVAWDVVDNDWFWVQSDVDWVPSTGRPAAELFRLLVPMPELGANSVRMEILVGAFAQQAFTIGPKGECEILVGPGPKSSLVEASRQRVGGGRLLLYRV